MKSKESSNINEKYVCKICLVSEVKIVFLPSGHLVTCTTCALQVSHCPLCRNNIKGSVKVYLG
ncbi:hypothetical protein B4U79_02760 [Dinothrombium tinctorium]|uniref:RING-type domain-containing protein n=1 Tax=Dinothrombium tinctorium TaxID=1965070 RepID=A0A443QJK9_9ACAR|nr:hypothetical protein B4U79_02760 [Dinothrombium tinctorium]